jgi:hypothetical protein
MMDDLLFPRLLHKNDMSNSGQIKSIVVLTQAAYDALGTPDPKIIYMISG